MQHAAVDKIVQSVLYEGYMLYPYRRSSLKNQHRWNFGLVYPADMSPSHMTTECLLQGGADAEVAVEVRFLQLFEQDSWQEVVERTLRIEQSGTHEFRFEPIHGDVQIGREPIQAGLHKIRVQIRNRTHTRQGQSALLQCLVSTHTVLSVRNGSFVSL